MIDFFKNMASFFLIFLPAHHFQELIQIVVQISILRSLIQQHQSIGINHRIHRVNAFGFFLVTVFPLFIDLDFSETVCYNSRIDKSKINFS